MAFVILVGTSSEGGSSYLLTVDYGEDTFLWSTYVDLDPEAGNPTPYSVQEAFMKCLASVIKRAPSTPKKKMREFLSEALEMLESHKEIPHCEKSPKT